MAGLDIRWLRDLVGEMGVDPQVTRPSADPELVYELAPGTSATTSHEPGALSPEEAPFADDPRTVTINAFGHRDLPRREAKAPGTLRILCLGGSNTYGATVSDPNPWPRQLEAELGARVQRPVEVWNLGVDGYKTRQKLRQAELGIARFDPDLILLQLWNTGPRLALPAPAELPLDDVGAWAGVWWENLLGSPRPDSPLFAVFERLALVRLVVVGGNRLWASRRPDARRARLEERAEVEAGRMFRAFLDAHPDGPPVVLFIPPVGGREHGLGGLDLPMFDLQRQLDRDRSPVPPDARLLHPGAAGYRLYAERLAAGLIEAGCLEAGGRRCALPSASVRHVRGPR